MKRRSAVLLVLTLAVVAAAAAVHARMTAMTSSTVGETAPPPSVPLQSIGALTFGPNNVLFVGDSKSASVFAIDVADAGRDEGTEAVRLDDVDRRIGSLLGVAPGDVVINDLAVHPRSQHVYLGITRGRGNDAVPVLLRVTKKGALEEVSLNGAKFSRVSLRNAPEAGVKDRWGNELRRMTVTDLAFADGELLVAGLSNTEFASTLRRAPYPFREDHAVNTLEVFHTSHDKYETQSPITSFVPFTLNGKPSLLAGYGCAPIASFALSDLKTKPHLRGVTLAELGGGSRPIDMVAFEKEGKRRLLIANSDRTLMSMSAEDLEKGTPMTKAVSAPYVSAGVPYLSIAEVGITQLDNLNPKFVVVVQRDIEDGSLDLRSLSKAWL